MLLTVKVDVVVVLRLWVAMPCVTVAPPLMVRLPGTVIVPGKPDRKVVPPLATSVEELIVVVPV